MSSSTAMSSLAATRRRVVCALLCAMFVLAMVLTVHGPAEAAPLGVSQSQALPADGGGDGEPNRPDPLSRHTSGHCGCKLLSPADLPAGERSEVGEEREPFALVASRVLHSGASEVPAEPPRA